jgi:hypothetical protein
MLLLFQEDDGHRTYQSFQATGLAQAGGTTAFQVLHYRNTAEYTTGGNVSQTAEYRHLGSGLDRDSAHRR